MPRKTVIIYADDDFDRLAEANTRVTIAERNLAQAKVDAGLARGGGDTEAEAAAKMALQEAKDAYDATVDKAAERADGWEIQSIGHEAWRDLLVKHPARKVAKDVSLTAETVVVAGEMVDHPDDAGWGFDTDKMPKALLLFVDQEDDEHRTVGAIGEELPIDLAKKVRRLSQGQFDTLWITAHQLNTGGVADPKASRYSNAPKSNE